jgi:hypothetical protein
MAKEDDQVEQTVVEAEAEGAGERPDMQSPA